MSTPRVVVYAVTLLTFATTARAQPANPAPPPVPEAAPTPPASDAGAAAPTPATAAPVTTPAPAQAAAELPPIVSASPPPPPPRRPLPSIPVADRNSARAAYQRGLELLMAERWQQALDAFERSYAALPTELALIDEALCLERLLRDDEAIAKLREFQERYGRHASPERRAAVARALGRLTGRNPRVAIRTSVRGAAIRVDGHDVGRTPLIEPFALRTGAHSIEASHPGHITVVRHVILVPTERREVVLDLERVASR